MAGGSPITGIIEENLVIIDFGRYEGKTVSEIADEDPEFYKRLVDQKDNFAIKRHRDKTFRLYVNPLFNVDN
jgi:broad specificity phosphatase PhoE